MPPSLNNPMSNGSSISVISENMKCGHPAGYGLHFTNTLDGTVESYCAKCLIDRVYQQTSQAPIFSEYGHTTNLNDPDLKGWVYIESFYTESLVDVCQETEQANQNNNWNAKFVNQKVVIKTTHFIFGKPAGDLTAKVFEAEDYKRKYESELVLSHFRAVEISKLVERQTSLDAQYRVDLSTEAVLRKKAQELVAQERLEKEALAIKLKALEDLETQEPLRHKPVILRPLEPEA